MSKDLDKQRGQFVFILMAGVFTTIMGVIGAIQSYDIGDLIAITSGVVIMGVGLYRIIIPFK